MSAGLFSAWWSVQDLAKVHTYLQVEVQGFGFLLSGLSVCVQKRKQKQKNSVDSPAVTK